MLRKFEVLAPAKNLECGIEAIKCGADAVYIGCEKLGLRYRTHNNIDDIEKLINFAHKYWAKVYVTLNATIYKEEDFKFVKQAFNKLYKIGVDAVIISDMGILTLNLPPIPIFASVNTRCLSEDKINFLTKIGIKRVILPRELSIEQIKNISKKTSCELETFIHGTICVAYTGNCYMKYAQMIKNTNAQKDLLDYQLTSSGAGACIANCVHFYNLLDANYNYIVKNDSLLNLRYLNLIDKMEDLFKLGITSFKIEGRQREISYVKNIVALANKKANEILKKNKRYGKRLSSGTSIAGFEPSLNKVFNRGFTEYFFYGRKPENSNSKTIYGTFIGKVLSQKKDILEINTKTKLSIGDRFLCSKGNKKVETVNIIDIQDNKFYKIKENIDINGYNLYRIVNAKAVEEIEKAFTYRYISVDLKILNSNKTKYKILVKDEDNIQTYITYRKDLKSKITKDTILNIFNKNKDYEFQIKNIKSEKNINIKEDDLLKIQEQLYIKLRKEREKFRPKQTCKINNNKNIKYPYEKLNCLENVVNKKASAFFRSHGVKEIEPAIESTKDIENRIICHCKYCIKYEQGYCSKKKRKDTPKEPWYLEDKFGNKYKLQFDCNKCEMNILG
jgi:putative protease